MLSEKILGFPYVTTSLRWFLVAIGCAYCVCRSSRFARLQDIHCSLAGRNVYMRFSCSTGDAMGMNMVSKGVQNVLDYLQADFPDIDIISISGQFFLFHFLGQMHDSDD